MNDLVEVNDLIVVKQLPVIEDRLDEALTAVQGRLKDAAALVVTDDNYKELKKVRADLNKEFGELETLLKEAVEAPYKKFETGAYKRLADEYKIAISKLDGEIKDVEIGLRSQRQEEISAYFDSYRQSLGIDSALVDLNRSGIKVGLSGSVKSLRDQVRAYLDGVDGDLKMIDTLDDRDEVLAEYRVLLSVTDAVRVVADRRKRIEEMRLKREAAEEERRQREAQIAAVNEAMQQAAQDASNSQDSAQEASVHVPTVERAEEPSEDATKYSAKYLGFEITGTMSQLKALKAFLKEELKKYMDREGIEYVG